jgi:hypothetical protein
VLIINSSKTKPGDTKVKEIGNNNDNGFSSIKRNPENYSVTRTM